MDNICLLSNEIDVFPNLNEEEKSEIKRILEKHSCNRERLILKSIEEIEKMVCKDFYIASYQRGYRWGKDEIVTLLDDIYAIKKNGSEFDYCMQPLVVKNVKSRTVALKLNAPDNPTYELEQCYELIDGQQRLTTLFLITNRFSELLETDTYKPKYNIYYEISRNIDEAFIKNAEKVIQNWIEDNFYHKKRKKPTEFNNDLRPDVEAIYDIIKNKLKFIWNEIPKNSEDTPEKVFRKINKGKIPLTNAELFKAMLLNYHESANKERKQEVEKIAFEWDKIEQELRNDDFWYFISNDTSDKKTRIDYILDIYASSLKESDCYDINKDRFSFFVVSKHLEKMKSVSSTDEWDNIHKVWEQIVELYDKIYSWYKDDELYHHIGFLVACRGKRHNSIELIKLLNNKSFKTKEEMRRYVKKECAEIIIPTPNDKKAKERDFEYFDYNNPYTENNDIRNFLLYSNIYEYLKHGMEEEKKETAQVYHNDFRFPFHIYKNTSWDIEHINPQTPEKDWQKTIVDKDELDSNKEIIVAWLNIKIKTEDINADELSIDSDNKLINEAWNKYCPNPGTGNISNLVLLNSSINRAYHNALFFQKRSKIIENDKAGVFILPVVKNVFLKYFTNSPSDLIEWIEADQNAYGDSLKSIFEKMKGWKKYDSQGN